MEKEKIEEKDKQIEENKNVFIDKLGRLNILGQEIFIDEDGNTKEYDFRITKPQNMQIYSMAYLNLSTNKSIVEFANAILPKMVEKPNEARKIQFFDNDPEALAELISAIIEYMGKSKETKKRKLNMTWN